MDNPVAALAVAAQLALDKFEKDYGNDQGQDWHDAQAGYIGDELNIALENLANPLLIHAVPVAGLLRLARQFMQTPPDIVIGSDDNPYLHRWYLDKSDRGNVYLHRFFRSDDDRALHDHPWWFRSLILTDGYFEITEQGKTWIEPGVWSEYRPAYFKHMVELKPGTSPITLVVTGPRVRDWGFHCPKRWVPWQEFTAPGPNGYSQHVGKGCDQ